MSLFCSVPGPYAKSRFVLTYQLNATGPLGADEVIVWVGKRGEGERRACTGL